MIDFGDVEYRDPSADFSALGDGAILEAALTAYDASDLLRRRAELRITAFPVLDLPFYVGKQDAAGVSGCVELVRKVVIQGRAS